MFGHKSDIGGYWTVLWPSVFATRYFSFATTFYTRQQVLATHRKNYCLSLSLPVDVNIFSTIYVKNTLTSSFKLNVIS